VFALRSCVKSPVVPEKLSSIWPEVNCTVDGARSISAVDDSMETSGPPMTSIEFCVKHPRVASKDHATRPKTQDHPSVFFW
jgi:hypothetical protein